MYGNFVIVLGLARMELTSLIAVYIVLWFGFLTEAMLVAHQCLAAAKQSLHSVETFSFSHSEPPESRLGMNKKLGRDRVWTIDSD